MAMAKCFFPLHIQLPFKVVYELNIVNGLILHRNNLCSCFAILHFLCKVLLVNSYPDAKFAT